MPRKAFLEDGEFAFEFFLAEKLGRTIGELRASISQAEFIEWNRFFAVRNQREQLAARG